MSTLPRIVGVLDVMNGHVVRAIGGRRDAYQPIRSDICESSQPIDVAHAFRREYGIEQLYVADLDAIRGGPANASTITDLVTEGFCVTLDAGFRDAVRVKNALASGVAACVAALETLTGFDSLHRFVEAIEPHQLWFSLDLVAGLPLADASVWKRDHWNEADALELARQVAGSGITQMIVLDLQAVGTSAGPATASLCRQIKSHCPHVTLWSGGGIRSMADVQAMRRAGVDGVLVASALHDRTLER